MSAVLIGAVVGAVIASSAVHSGPSEPLTQGTAIFCLVLLVLLALSLVGGSICAYRSRWDKWANLFFGTICTACGLVVLLVGLFGLVCAAVGL